MHTYTMTCHDTNSVIANQNVIRPFHANGPDLAIHTGAAISSLDDVIRVAQQAAAVIASIGTMSGGGTRSEQGERSRGGPGSSRGRGRSATDGAFPSSGGGLPSYTVTPAFGEGRESRPSNGEAESFPWDEAHRAWDREWNTREAAVLIAPLAARAGR